jgi:hypothetical protein
MTIHDGRAFVRQASIGAEMKRQYRGAALERAIAQWIAERNKP